ncbi:PolC-type DNA polymerase III [Candidatus Mycoplasma haematominutum]|uniref:DNA polymerase III PolC-type n=1 Tax=Candidatus Mycoplasma haematominutum 'Birmingham 1' TaxID=1116213 RepID=G8C303_9MOLU|nr:PolC-type DNA polymerase III [Candidatus Mycoplasma haematominutum]CCE66701.1 DNA polymerase III, polC-type [Candidatus Mycoplasma haematominutum 'Birmingham 1']
MIKETESVQFQKLFVQLLHLFSPEEFEKLEEKAEFYGKFSEYKKRFILTIVYFAEPDFQELLKLFYFTSSICVLRIELNYMYNPQSMFTLLYKWFDNLRGDEVLAPATNTIPTFKEKHLIFEFPQFLLKAENIAHEKFFQLHLKNLKNFLEFLFDYSQIFISILKVENLPFKNISAATETVNSALSNPSLEAPMARGDLGFYDQRLDQKRGIFKLYFLESMESRYGVQMFGKKTLNYKTGFTNFYEQYYLSLNNRVIPEEGKEEFLAQLKVNRWFEIEFKLDLKNTTKYDGRILKIIPTEAPSEFQLEDRSPRKAFPLNVYTKYSSFDGLFSTEEWADTMSTLGYPVLALTDFNNTHSFPDSEKIIHKYGLKPLYGAEMEVISERLQIISNLESFPEGEEIIFSLFDLETTGLNPLFDEIIEIYILKYSRGMVLDTFHSYLKCDKTLSQEIINLTHITAEKLDILGRDKLDVLREVREFVAGTILIAHNGADFDLPFLNAQYKKANLEPLDMPLLDTLLLAKALEKDKKSKSYSLAAVAKKMCVNIVEQELHSSEYDTHCLARLWRIWEKQLIELSLDPYLYESLNKLNTSFEYHKLLVNHFGSNLIIFAKNQEGLHNLYELISKAHTENFAERPRLHWSDIESLRENLVLLSSPSNSAVLSAVFKDDFSEFQKEGKRIDYLSLPPPSLFLHEINRGYYSLEDIQLLLQKFYDWSQKCQFKLIANYCLKYMFYKEIEQYKVLVHAKNIGGKRHPLYSSKSSNEVLPDYSLRTTEKLIREFDFLKLNEAQIEELFFEHREDLVAEISPNIQINLTKLSLPKISGALENIKEHISKRLREKYGPKPNTFLQTTIYRELSGIVENGFESVYWCAHLLVKRSKAEGFLVGSRGSVGSSFLAYVLEISEVNPLPPHYFCNKCSYFLLNEKFRESGFDLEPKICPNCAIELFTDGQNIPFETFLGLERKKVPDIDLNFSGQYQQKAHRFVRELFGKDHTFRTGTISAVAEKTSFALAKNYLMDNNIPFNKGKLHWLAKRIIDVKRTTGQHPGGIIVIPKGDSIYKYTPVNYPANDITSEWLTTHFEKDALKDSLFKFDILGQDDPTILALLSKFTGVNLEKIEYRDASILKMFGDISVLEIPPERLEILGESTGTLGLPEFGTEKTREIIKACKGKVNYFSDLVRISGISHGKNVWKGNIEQLMTKRNLTLTEVITCRDDIMNYLLEKKLSIEQSFKITESVRRGFGISPEDLPFLKSAGVPDWYIDCANKITYIFPKAHATAYVLMCWKIAFFKLYYAVEFYAAYLTITNKHFDIETIMTNDLSFIKNKYCAGKIMIKGKADQENVEKTKYLVNIYEVAMEMIARGIKFRMIDINESWASTFKPDPRNRTVLLPFSSITGLGAITATQLEEERAAHGEYTNRADLEARVKLNVKILKVFENLNIIEARK